MRSLTTAAGGLKTYWRSAFVLVVTLVAALAVSLTVSSWILPDYPVLAPRFSLPVIPSWDTGAPWSARAGLPAVLQWTAMVNLFRSLLSQTVIVCLIATVTILGVSFARASERAAEVSVRRAVGATRGTVVRSALFEIAAIALLAISVGGLIGVVVGGRALRDWQGVVWPASVFSVATVILAVMVVLAADAALTAAPAWRRVLPPPLSKTPLLGIAALQLGLSIVGVAAGQEFREAFAKLHVLQPSRAEATGRLYQLSASASTREARAKSYDTLLHTLPAGSFDLSLESPGTRVGLGVADVGMVDCGRCRVPLNMIRGSAPVAPTHFLVSADTFRMLGMSLIEGRGIEATDRLGAEPVAVVSRSLALAFQRPPIGRRVRIGVTGTPRWYRVVGVVEDRMPEALGGQSDFGPSVYLSALQHPAENLELVMRARDGQAVPDVAALADAAGLRVASQSTEREALDREAAPLTWFARVLDREGWVALVLACLGTATLMLIWVQSIRAELGIRRAVGATRRRLIGYVLVRAVAVAAGGVVVARWLGGIVWYWVTAVVPGVPDLTWTTLLQVSAVLVATALIAAALPAWRAAHISPAALQSD